MKKLFLLNILLTIIFSAFSQKITKEEYINRYKKISIEEMRRSGIPASITMAQGILESDCGNSTLAYKSNNHFGIKCHKNWSGKKVYHDDDRDNECFRKYPTAEDSYRDHTNFLLNGSRYNKLFEYKSNDYKSWAKGLKKAGYATSSTYAQMLIKIIEENELYKLDEGDLSRPSVKSKNNFSEEVTIDIKRRKIYERNRIKYIIVEQGDNIYRITKEMGLLRWEINRYNELSNDAEIKAGQVLYIQPKRRSAETGNDFHFVKESETMYSISQIYGIKLSKLLRKNRMKIDQKPEVGQKIWLRKRKPASEVIPQTVPEKTTETPVVLND